MDIEIINTLMEGGGFFFVTLVLLFIFYKKMGSIEAKMIKMLTLITVLIKELTKFNHVDDVFDEEEKGVKDELKRAGVDL